MTMTATRRRKRTKKQSGNSRQSFLPFLWATVAVAVAAMTTTTSRMSIRTTTALPTTALWALWSSVVVMNVVQSQELPPPPSPPPEEEEDEEEAAPPLYACGNYSGAQPFPFNVSSLLLPQHSLHEKNNQTRNVEDDNVVVVDDDDNNYDDAFSSPSLVDVTVLVLDVTCAHDSDKNPDYRGNPSVVPRQIHIHLYALMEEEKEEDKNEQQHERQEPRWNCFPPSLVRPVLNTDSNGSRGDGIIMNDHDSTAAAASIPWLELNQTWYRPSGLHFVYDNGSDHDPSATTTTTTGRTGACIELWLPMSILEALTVVGPAFDHVADIQVPPAAAAAAAAAAVDHQKVENDEEDGHATTTATTTTTTRTKHRHHHHLTVWNAGAGTQLLINITSPTTTLELVDQSLQSTYQVLLLGSDNVDHGSGGGDGNGEAIVVQVENDSNHSNNAAADDDDGVDNTINAIWTLGSNTQGFVMSERDDLQLVLSGFHETLYFTGDFETITINGSAIQLVSTEQDDTKYNESGGFCAQVDMTEEALYMARRGGRNSTCTIVGNVTMFPQPVAPTCLSTTTTTKTLNCLVSEATTTTKRVLSSRWRWYGSSFLLGLFMEYVA